GTAAGTSAKQPAQHQYLCGAWLSAAPALDPPTSLVPAIPKQLDLVFSLDLGLKFPSSNLLDVALEVILTCASVSQAAEGARRALAQFGENPDVYRELAVDGSLFTVKWAALDQGCLQTVLNEFLNDLALLLRTMRRFGPPFLTECSGGKGG
ncbi:EKC/KEOPS complex subunit Lage3-like, partial [Octodon degus]|uniref:EKC/KEOPS complex subunit Lage3-like n=1 Tax=Octodon degus TaxID=10160 RepID=A0A6P6DW33_OCTDE